MSARPIARLAALGLVRILGYVVAVVALAAGVGYLIAAATGSPVWVSGVAGERGFVQLPLPLSVVHAIAFLLGTVTVASIALIVGGLAWRIRRGVEFVPAVSRSARALAIVLAAGSWLTQIAVTIAEQSALIYPDDLDPSTVQLIDLHIAWTVLPQSFLPDAPMLGLAIVLGVLAYLIQAGERVQHDVDGLV